jgi:hypothetical protein
VPLSASGLVGGNKEITKVWSEIVLKNLNRSTTQEQY